MSSNDKPRVTLGTPKPPAPPVVASMLRPPHDGSAVHCRALGDRGYGCLCHWDGSRLRLHWPAPIACRGCLDGHEMRWVAFYAVQDANTKKRAVLALTREAIVSCPALCPDEGQDIRGRMISVWRSKTERGKPYRAKISDERSPAHCCTPPFNLARALEHILGYPEGTLQLPDDGQVDAEEAIRYGETEEAGGAV